MFQRCILVAAVIAFLPLAQNITSYKLEIIASQLGVELDDAHDAAADVTATIDVLGAYTARLRNNEGVTVSAQPRDKTRKHFKI